MSKYCRFITNSLIKYSNLNILNAIAAELEGHVLELAKNQNGHCVIKSLIKYGNQILSNSIASELEGHVLELASNK